MIRLESKMSGEERREGAAIPLRAAKRGTGFFLKKGENI